jgi:hypothetical protein
MQLLDRHCMCDRYIAGAKYSNSCDSAATLIHLNPIENHLDRARIPIAMYHLRGPLHPTPREIPAQLQCTRAWAASILISCHHGWGLMFNTSLE